MITYNPYKMAAPHIQNLLSMRGTGTDADHTKINLNTHENALGSPLVKWYNRCHHSHLALQDVISSVKAAAVSDILLANGGAACIDMLVRCFCNPSSDYIIVCSPVQNKFEKSAAINNVAVKHALLLPDFQLDMIHLENLVDEHCKMIVLESPGSVAGNALRRDDVEMLLNNFNGLVVIDETFINFSRQQSFVKELGDYDNLVVLQNFDVAWGLAGLDVSMLFANEPIVSLLQMLQPLYPVNIPTQELLLKALPEVGMVNDMIKELVQMRAALKKVLERFTFVQMIYPSDANFLLLKVTNAPQLCADLFAEGIAIKNMHDLPGCENCVRITIGTEEENTQLIEALLKIKP